ncbi:MAG TPA: hypothetical protein PKI05_13165, partial [Thermogutta sp.]|nr:hypothetical protein [Thermogutta sp.]
MIGKKELKPNDVEVISSEGEIRVGMKDGVRYLLRFGQVVAGGSSGQEGEGGAGVNRYLFVMAEFDPDLIPKPELQPLPEVPSEGQSPAATTGTSQSQSAATEEAQSGTSVTQGSAPPEQSSGSEEAKSQTSEEKPAEQQKKPEDIKAERERIEKENKRKQDEYEEKLKKGQER